MNFDRVAAAVVCLLYIAVVAHTPIAALPPAAHDDGWYMAIGHHIAEGQWLGPYSQYTLIKGPGYPLFSVAANIF
jgi:hypothetical protein